MTTLATPHAYGVITEPATLTIQRLLPGPIERIWAYLTDGELRRKWLAAGTMELKVGAPFEFVWRNDELTDPPGPRPDRFPEEDRLQSRITAVDPPHRLAFDWQDSDGVTIDLETVGNDVLLTVTHRRLPSRTTLIDVASGWHRHLDFLVAQANGSQEGPFWAGWSRLHEEYSRRIPADAGGPAD